MNKITSAIVALHSYQYAAKSSSHVAKNNLDTSIKLGTTMLVALPPVALVVVLLAIVGPQLRPNEIRVYIVVATIVSIFGLSFITDRVYDRNASQVKALAVEILGDPQKGRSWARRRIAAVSLAQLAFVAVLAVLGRAYVVYGTDLPFVSI